MVRSTLAERRRDLQLETLYDLLVALHEHRSEQEMVEDLVGRVCAVVDPAAAVAVTRDAFGVPLASSVVGWENGPPAAEELLADPLWRDLLGQGAALARSQGRTAGRAFREMLAAPLSYRGVILGYLAIFDKESRRPEVDQFTAEDRRFLNGVAAIAGVALDGLRQRQTLVSESERLLEENKLLKQRFVEEIAGQRVVAHAPALRSILEVVERVAPRNVTVLLRGESGTGKELIARILHGRSGRRGPLVAVNCAAMPESLLESELFGIERGVATGVDARTGKFELAQGGTLFLDEIGDLDVTLQVKLLRALQEKEITRVGGTRPVKLDVRVVVATHRPLQQLINEGCFREDLYYRLKGIELELPPLRDRREDIPHFVRYFAERFAEREGIETPRMDQEALALLLTYDYPGNVRELQNVVEGAVSLADGVIGASLVQSLIGSDEAGGPEALDLETLSRRHIRRVLRLTSGNKSAAAKILGVDRRTLSRKGF